MGRDASRPYKSAVTLCEPILGCKGNHSPLHANFRFVGAGYILPKPDLLQINQGAIYRAPTGAFFSRIGEQLHAKIDHYVIVYTHHIVVMTLQIFRSKTNHSQTNPLQ